MTGRKPWKRDGRNDAPEAGDEIEGGYTREQLLEMNEKFVARVEGAIRAGRECRPTNAVPPLHRGRSTPPTSVCSPSTTARSRVW